MIQKRSVGWEGRSQRSQRLGPGVSLTPSSQEKRGRAKHGARPHEAGSVPLAHVPDEETVALRAQAPQCVYLLY